MIRVHEFTHFFTPKPVKHTFSYKNTLFMIRVHEFTHFFTPKLVKVCFYNKQCFTTFELFFTLKSIVFIQKTYILLKKHVFYK